MKRLTGLRHVFFIAFALSAICLVVFCSLYVVHKSQSNPDNVTVQRDECPNGSWGFNCVCNSNTLAQLFCYNTTYFFICNIPQIPPALQPCAPGLICVVSQNLCDYPPAQSTTAQSAPTQSTTSVATTDQSTTAQSTTSPQTTNTETTAQATTSQATTSKATTSQATTSKATTSQATTSQATTSKATTAQATTAQATTAKATTSQATTSQATTAQATTSQATTSQATTSQATTSQATTGQSIVPNNQTQSSPANLNGLQLVGYWGQSDLVHDYPLTTANFALYNQINVAFAIQFSPNPQCTLSDGSTISYVGMNFAGYCGSYLNPCPNLLTCPTMAQGIQYIQSQGKRVSITMGGSAGVYANPSSSAEASQLAQIMWDMFLGGNCEYRPFGSVILDGVDLDIETGGTEYWDDFVIALRSLMNSATVLPPSGRYWITGAPQCPYPEPYWGSASAANTILGNPTSAQAIDFLTVQFYPNQGGCQITASGFESSFQTWASWAQTYGKKVMVGVPSAPGAAAAGYLSTAQLQPILANLYATYPNQFGGVMFWNTEFAISNPDEPYDYNTYNILQSL
jgi:chitinase